jgi:flagellar basal body-associated protein FliL
MSKHTTVLILVALMLVLVVAACGAAPTTTPLPTATKAAAAPTATKAAASTASAPAIPHDLAGRDNCLQCHAAGGVKPAPANHAGRTVDTCQTCHKVR